MHDECGQVGHLPVHGVRSHVRVGRVVLLPPRPRRSKVIAVIAGVSAEASAATVDRSLNAPQMRDHRWAVTASKAIVAPSAEVRTSSVSEEAVLQQRY